jgi:hypothetical protein
MHYLYIKQHKLTGLKYLGYTQALDPYTYLGSGTYWKRHLDLHGTDINTTILLATEIKTEVTETGLFFSKFFNVVNSKEWANLKEECGDGGWDYVNSNKLYLKRSSLQGENNPFYGKKHTDISKELMSNSKIGLKLGKQTAEHIEASRIARCLSYKLISLEGLEYVTKDLISFCTCSVGIYTYGTLTWQHALYDKLTITRLRAHLLY